MISDLNGSLGSGYFLYVMNERTSFASRASAFESSRLVNRSNEGLTLETPAFLLFTVANLRFQLSC